MSAGRWDNPSGYWLGNYARHYGSRLGLRGRPVVPSVVVVPFDKGALDPLAVFDGRLEVDAADHASTDRIAAATIRMKRPTLMAVSRL